ncbi:MAG: 50S ribosomal protein P1 [Candidatus Micrarchaeota archaeon]|nr:50S ribosomal protein P1 [Candidatus Micrarchaeota archaeon]
MKIDPYLHAALLLKGAEKEITKDALLSVLKAAGAPADEAKAQVLAEAVKGVNFDELLKAAAVPVAASSASGAAAAPAAGEAKKEEKKEDAAKAEAAAAEGLASLFG